MAKAFLLIFLTISVEAQQLATAAGADQASTAGMRGGASSFPKQTEPAPQLPDAPSDVQKVSGWRRRAVLEPAISNRAALNKRFIFAHTLLLSATIFDVEMTHEGIAHHRCPEGNPDLPAHPSRFQTYKGAMIPVLAFTAFDFFMAKERIPLVPYMAPAYGSFVHLQGGSEWLTKNCW